MGIRVCSLGSWLIEIILCLIFHKLTQLKMSYVYLMCDN